MAGASTLDMLLAEAEGALSPAGRHELVRGGQQARAGNADEPASLHVRRPVGDSQALVGDSPLPPPPSYFKEATAEADEASTGAREPLPATAGDNCESRRKESAESSLVRVPAKKSAAKMRKNADSATKCRQLDGANGSTSAPVEEAPFLLESTDASTARQGAAEAQVALAEDHAASRENYNEEQRLGDMFALEARCQGTMVSEASKQAEKDASLLLEASICGAAKVQGNEQGSQSPATSSKSLSPEEFKEKVDRKIAYFETLARESRIKADQDAAAEQSLQEARSRIEASSTKRQSLLLSNAKSGPGRAVLAGEDTEQDRRCLNFGPGGLSLNDLTDDSADHNAMDGREAADCKVVSTEAGKDVPGKNSIAICNGGPDPEARADVSGADSKVVAQGINPKTMFGISPVIEATTPDLSGDRSSCVEGDSSACMQQALFLQERADVCEQQPGPEGQIQKETTTTKTPTVQTGKSCSWAGVLACATPCPEQESMPRLTETECNEETLPSQEPTQRDSRQHKLILGKLDMFLESLRSPYGATTVGSPASQHDSSKSSKPDQATDSMPLPAGAVDTACTDQNTHAGDERKQRAVARREAFLASMNQLMEEKLGEPPKSCPAAQKIDCVVEEPENVSLQCLERRAQHLSDIASCEVSLTDGGSIKASFASSPAPDQCASEDVSCTTSSVGINADASRSKDSATAGHPEGSETKSSLESSQAFTGAVRNKLSARSLDDSSRETGKTHEGRASEDEKEKPAGIGVQVKRVRGLITVVDLMPDGPAAKYLKKGQVILQIDGAGVATLPFKTVLARFRGRPGSVVLLSVVDSAASLKAGQEPQTIGVQRFAACTSVRRTAFELPSGSLPAPELAVTADKSRKSSSFAPIIPRVENETHESGLCSPYSDPGDAVAAREASPNLDGQATGGRASKPSGALSIDSLHNRLLERLFGGNMTSTSGSAGTDDSAISNLAPSVMLMTPSHEMSPLPSGGSGRPHRPSTAVPAAAGLSVMQEAEEKFRCLAKHLSPTRALGAHAYTRKSEGKNQVVPHDEHGKRVRSPNADDITQPQSRSGKRMRHGGGVGAGGPSRSTLPRKPAVPCFSGRSTSAPKLRPNPAHEPSLGSASQAQRHTRKSSAGVRTHVTVHAPIEKTVRLHASASRIPSKEAFDGQNKTAPLGRKPAQGRALSRASADRGRAGRYDGKMLDRSQNLGYDESMMVYADVGRAVTSLVQQLSIVPDPHRSGSIPDKNAIIEALGRLAADSEHTPSASTDARYQAAGRAPAIAADKENMGNSLKRNATGDRGGREASSAGIGMRGPAAGGLGRKSAGHADVYRAKKHPRQRDDESKEDGPLTYVSVLKSRFGL